MAPHSSTLAWKIPWTEESGRLQSMGSLRVGHDWATSLSHIGEGNGNPLQCSCLENPRGGGAWWAAVYGVAQSRTQLKWLNSSSSLHSIPIAIAPLPPGIKDPPWSFLTIRHRSPTGILNSNIVWKTGNAEKKFILTLWTSHSFPKPDENHSWITCHFRLSMALSFYFVVNN